MSFNRRHFLKLLGASSAAPLLSSPVRAAARPHIVVVGGGFGGATVAKYLRIWSEGTVDVTLIDQRDNHVSCVLSNGVLNDTMTLNELRLPLSRLSALYGVNFVRDRVTSVDSSSRKVLLRSGGSISFDRAVLAAGIAFRRVDGQDYAKVPHAWIAGGQTTILRRQVARLRAGSTFVMSVPKSPYRCPPGPYERACLVADILVRKGYEGDSRVILLDENDTVQAERHTFETAFSGIYRNVIEYIPGVTINHVDSDHLLVETSAGDFAGDAVNLIPRQRAPWWMGKDGLTDGTGWARVNPLTYESTNPGMEGIHVIGDSQATGQPKSAHMANSQAKICADAILRMLADAPTDTDERMENLTTNSACYSPITIDTASWLTANFAYNKASGAMELSHIGEAERPSRENFRQMFGWASNLFTDSFS